MPKPPIERHDYQTQLEYRATDDLPAGVIGRVTGIALVYNVTDAWGTRFAPGSLDRTRREKLAAGRIQLFVAEDDGSHQYGTRTHVGTVRSLEDVGDNVVMSADLHQTPSAATLKQYLGAVLGTGGFTGLSIGFRPRQTQEVRDENGDPVLEITEAELAEITVTPIPAVPGTKVLGVRAEPQDDDSSDEPAPVLAFRGLLKHMPRDVAMRELAAHYGRSTSDDPDASERPSEDMPSPESDAPAQDTPPPVPFEDRIIAVRHLYGSI